MGLDCCLKQFEQSMGAVRLLLCWGAGLGERLSGIMLGYSECIVWREGIKQEGMWDWNSNELVFSFKTQKKNEEGAIRKWKYYLYKGVVAAMLCHLLGSLYRSIEIKGLMCCYICFNWRDVHVLGCQEEKIWSETSLFVQWPVVPMLGLGIAVLKPTESKVPDMVPLCQLVKLASS